ncbi:peptidoglycan-associated lipoprotein [bacterium K02(2017)]|nr:peptidoglycan-associated lipoprotein [bacterium K02(2017)]
MKSFFQICLILLVGSVFINCQNKKIAAPTSNYSLQSVYFDYDQDFIRGDATGSMQGNAGYLKQHPNTTVTIEGNCDSRGTNEYNLALGQRRATSSKNYLVNLGISPSRMNTVSYGEEKQVCYNNNESCWQRNRRVDLRR